MNPGPESSMVHQACLYGSAEQFLATAVPFVRDGLAMGQPVLVVTTSANLELLGSALGADAGRIHYGESAYFGRRPAQRITAFHRYWQRHSSYVGRYVRILNEPVWPGRSEREVQAWTCMESAFNATFADTNIWMMCPYDTRAVAPRIAADARCTHPALVEATTTRWSPDFVEPATFAARHATAELPAPPEGADSLAFEDDLYGLRGFVAAQAAAHGLIGNRAATLVISAGDVATFLMKEGASATTVRMWPAAGSLVCDFWQPGGRIPQADLVGLRPPRAGAEPDPGDGIWLARQLCDWVDVRSTGAGATIRLQIPGPRSEENLL